MRLLANENFPLSSTKILSEAGFDVLSIGIDFQGITDQEVITIAQKEKRLILTFDRDYGELIFKSGLKPEGLTPQSTKTIFVLAKTLSSDFRCAK